MKRRRKGKVFALFRLFSFSGRFSTSSRLGAVPFYLFYQLVKSTFPLWYSKTNERIRPNGTSFLCLCVIIPVSDRIDLLR